MNIEKMELYAWVGEDEFGSGVAGIKQALVQVSPVASGFIPLVSIDKDKLNNQNITSQLQRQSSAYGKTIRLCKFVLEDVEVTLNPVGVN
jgi:hypothetical protein